MANVEIRKERTSMELLEKVLDINVKIKTDKNYQLLTSTFLSVFILTFIFSLLDYIL